MDVHLVLCDWAEVLNGKLYLMGAGWSRVIPGQPLLIAVAVLLKVPWTKTNEQHRLEIAFVDADNNPVTTQINPQGDMQPVRIEGRFEVGRPPGLKVGTDIDSPMAFKIGPLVLNPGRYEFQLSIDGSVEATSSFEVMAPPQLIGGVIQQ